MSVDVITRALQAHRFRYSSELELHLGIAQVLERTGLPFTREVQLSPTDRIDFLAGDVGVEVKVARRAQAGDVSRQLYRYASHDRISALVLVTDRNQLAHQPATVRGKPLRVIALQSGLQ